VGSADRRIQRATYRVRRTFGDLGEEFRAARGAGGLSQLRVATEAGMSRSRYTRIEAGRVETLRLDEAAKLAAVLGLDLSVKLYPGGGPLRDQAHAGRLSRFLAPVSRPLRAIREVPLPSRDGVPEQRAWDAMIVGRGVRTAVELEMRIRDAQALERRVALKRRDDPTEQFLLALANTRTNRRVLLEQPELFADLPRLRPSIVARALRAGRHPPTGLVLV
jgi:transcriptional regulator with XRE-family HTH domain